MRLSWAHREVTGRAIISRPAKAAVLAFTVALVKATRPPTATAMAMTEGSRVHHGSEEMAVHGFISTYRGPGAGSVLAMTLNMAPHERWVLVTATRYSSKR